MSLATQISSTVIANAESLLGQAISYADEAIKQSENIDINALTVNVGNPSFAGINIAQFNPSADLRADYINKFNQEAQTLLPLLNNALAYFEATYFPGTRYWDEVHDLLYQQIVSQSIGLSPAVENQMWDRARTKNMQENKRIKAEAYKEGANRGFSIPPAMIATRVLESVNTGAKSLAITNAEIAIESAKMKIDYLKFAITTILDMENKAKAFAMEYAKDVLSTHTIAIDFAKGYVSSYQIFYQTLVAYYDAVTKVEALKVQVSVESAKIQLEAQKVGVTAQIGSAEVRAKGAIAACNATASMASSALSGLNALGSEINQTTASS